MKRRPASESAAVRVRCAIYTRKSTDENLDAEFNSLDAQRESAESYIASQRHEGWVALPDRYDDGGYSGGNLERPGLQRLLADVEAGRIDCILVYKLDRLSRSLLDFVKMIEIFERHRISFVSVTQRFDTSTSMGRLMLNILLSFAQFEREIIGERIRDKISATRKKGKYIGGPPVLGYDVDRERKRLVVDEGEATLVRTVFSRFVATGSTTKLAQELNEQGHTTKCWTTKQGITRAGKPWSKARLYQVLHNPLYLGEVTHKGEHYPGEHEAIISRQLWDQAHAVLAKHRRVRGGRPRVNGPALLRGILHCAHCGCVMGPVFTKRRGRVYRYYLCLHASRHGHSSCPTRSLAAGEIERVVVDQLRRLLRTPQMLAGGCPGAATVGKRDLARVTALAFALADNRTAEIAQWDEPSLAGLLKRLDAEGELASSGFSDDDLGSLLARLDAQEKSGREETFDPDRAMAEAEQQSVATRVQPGGIWRLGRHRLLCGDATDPTNWERLMAGETAHAIITDPPYGVSYTGGRCVDPERIHGGTAAHGAALERVDAYWDAMSGDEYADMLARFLVLAHRHSDEQAPLYLWFASVNIRHVLASLDTASWRERTLIVWVKNVHAGNLFAQYKYRMEPLYYAHKVGRAPRWHGPTNEVNVWEYPKPVANDLHPTMKPLPLIERSIQNATELGQLVVDPFLGSGTAIIAAERTGRRCFGFDLDARYCSVIVERWESFTGEAAEEIDG